MAKSTFPLEVVATTKGYYGGRIQNEGDRFLVMKEEDLAHADNEGGWMRPIKEAEGWTPADSLAEKENARAARAGAQGSDPNLIVHDGKLQHISQVVEDEFDETDENDVGPDDAEPAEPKVAVSQGAAVEVGADWKPSPEPSPEPTRDPGPGKTIADAQRAPAAPRPSTRTASSTTKPKGK